MAEAPKEQKPGTGIDRTAIRRLLALTPAQRVELLVAEAHALSELDQKLRIRLPGEPQGDDSQRG